MNWKLPAGIAALLVILLLLVPLVNHLIGGLEGLVQDIKDDRDRQNLDREDLGGVRDPQLGGVSGQSDGNYQSKPADPATPLAPDRNSEAGDVVCDYVFEPALGCMKRLVSLDSLDSAYNLRVGKPGLRTTPVGDLNVPATHAERFVGRFPVRLEPERTTPIFSVAPDAIIGSYRTIPPVSLEFLKDGADGFHVRGSFAGTVELEVVMWAPSSYFTFRVPSSLTLSELPGGLVGSFPEPLRTSAARAVASLNLSGERNLARILTTLKDYYSGFGEGEIPGSDVQPDIFLAIHEGRNGCCRHRAFAFLVTAQSLGIPTRFIANEAHAFVEVYVPTVGWEQINLGGCGTYRASNPEGYDRYGPVGRNATNPKVPARPRPDDPPVPPPPTRRVVLTTTDITQSPQEVRKGQQFSVEGVVAELATGAPVSGIPVRLFLNVTKTTPGDLIGQGTTDVQGRFTISATASSLPASDYQLVAGAVRTAKNATHDWGESWSDPPIRVVAETTILLSVPAREGVSAPVRIGGRVVDERGDPVSFQRVVVAVGNRSPEEPQTGSNGEFHVEKTFTETGTVPVAVSYAGNDNYLPSAANASIEILEITFTLDRDNVSAVRDQTASVAGAVRLGPDPQAGELVRGTFDFAPGAPPVSGPTDAAGRFALSAAVPQSATLGPRSGNVTLVSFRIVKPIVVTVYATPHLALAHPSQVETHAAVTLQLLERAPGGDGTSAPPPVPNATVRLVVRQGGSSVQSHVLVTDETGGANLTLNLSQHVGELELEAAFEAEKYLLNATSRGRVTVRGVPAPPAPVAPYALAAVPVLSIVAAVLYKRRADRRQSTSLTLVGERPTLRIEFPQIEDPLPAVWGSGEPLQIRFRFLDPKGAPVPNVALSTKIGPESVSLSTDPHGTAALERVFAQETEVPILAEVKAKRGSLGVKTLVLLRIVDYRKEVGREYEEFQRLLRSQGVRIPADLAPREFEAVLADAVSTARPEIDSMLTRFEYANYSLRAFGRPDYVAFMRNKIAVVSQLPGPAVGSEEKRSAGGDSHGEPGKTS